MSFGPKTGYRDGGNRGGQDRFKWEDVKDEHYREHYLGHSLKAPVGRWQKGKDLMWYTKADKGGEKGKEDAEAQRRRELAEFRRRDEDMINAALGLAPARQAVVETTLDASELKQLLARGASERGDMDAERVEGLGAAPAARHEHLPKGKSMVEREIERMKKEQAEGRAFEYEEDASHMHEEEGNDVVKDGGGKRKKNRDEDKEKKEKKKRKKEEKKKEEKKKKKVVKKERKKAKKAMRKEEDDVGAGREGGRGKGRSERGRSSSDNSCRSSSVGPEHRMRHVSIDKTHHDGAEKRQREAGRCGGKRPERERGRSASRSSRSASPDDRKRRRLRTESISRSRSRPRNSYVREQGRRRGR